VLIGNKVRAPALATRTHRPAQQSYLNRCRPFSVLGIPRKGSSPFAPQDTGSSGLAEDSPQRAKADPPNRMHSGAQLSSGPALRAGNAALRIRTAPPKAAPPYLRSGNPLHHMTTVNRGSDQSGPDPTPILRTSHSIMRDRRTRMAHSYGIVVWRGPRTFTRKFAERTDQPSHAFSFAPADPKSI
jgi:hypothetical protein